MMIDTAQIVAVDLGLGAHKSVTLGPGLLYHRVNDSFACNLKH